MTKPARDLTPEIRSFVEARTLPAVREALTILQRNKSLTRAARDPAFAGQLEQLRSLSLTGGGPTQLEALALLFRIGAGVKALRPQLEAIASEIVTSPSVPPQKLEDPDDRRYVGEALTFSSGDWKREYLARAVVEEVSGEEARAAFTAGLVGACGNVAGALQALRTAFDGWSVGTRDIAASRVRRLIRVASSLKGSIIQLDPPPGDGFGAALQAFTRAALGGESVEERGLQNQAAAALLDLMATTVRFHFSLASDIETFSIIPLLRRWFRSRGWPPELNTERRAVAHQITEALVLLARQGIADEPLRKVLLLVLNEGEAENELGRLANEVRGIPSSLRPWLLSGRLQPAQVVTSEALEETVLRSIDQDIAALFRDATELGAILDRLDEDFSAAFDAYEPKLVPTARRLRSTARRIDNRTTALAARRSMRFAGRTGDLVEFNPVDHEAPTGSPSRVVRLKYPSVERLVEGAPPVVILKAEVEGSNEGHGS